MKPEEERKMKGKKKKIMLVVVVAVVDEYIALVFQFIILCKIFWSTYHGN